MESTRENLQKEMVQRVAAIDKGLRESLSSAVSGAISNQVSYTFTFHLISSDYSSQPTKAEKVYGIRGMPLISNNFPDYWSVLFLYLIVLTDVGFIRIELELKFYNKQK